MRQTIAVALAAVALVVLAIAPPQAAADYKVTKNCGRTVGRVVPGPVPSPGDDLGVVRRDLAKVRGAVYSRQSSSGYWGWPVSNGSAYVAWATKASSSRFLIKKLPWSSASGRATKLSSGWWIAQKKVEGRWVTIGTIQEGCRGHWAAGAARLLLW